MKSFPQLKLEFHMQKIWIPVYWIHQEWLNQTTVLTQEWLRWIGIMNLTIHMRRMSSLIGITYLILISTIQLKMNQS